MIAPVQLCVDAHAQKNDGFLFANGYFEINSVHVKCVVSGNFTFCKFSKWNFYLEHIKSEFGRFVGYWTCFVRWVSFDFSNFHGKLNPRMRRNAHNLCGLTSTHTHTHPTEVVSDTKYLFYRLEALGSHTLNTNWIYRCFSHIHSLTV